MSSLKNKIVVMFLIASFTGFAVNDLNKVDALFKASKYEKAYKKANKLKGDAAYYKKSKTYYYLGFSLLNLSKSKAQRLGVSNRDRSVITSIKKGVKYQKSSSDLQRFKNYFSAFKLIAKERIISAKKRKREKEWHEIINLLANHFSDTIPEYWEIYKKEESRVGDEELSIQKEKINSSREDSILQWARTYIGTPYKWAGESRKGIDCSGFTLTVLNQFGANLDHSSKKQSTSGEKVKKYQVGDLAFFGGYYKGKYVISHVGIVISNYPESLRVIHSTTSKGVREDDIKNSTYWSKKFLYTVRVLK